MPLDCRNIPLSLYIHVPWCVRKCPYCDFNSHAVQGDIAEMPFVDALLTDLTSELDRIEGRPLHSLFIGGGTPSLLSDIAVKRLLDGVRDCIDLVTDCEITLEANPGTMEADRYSSYLDAGVNRLSIGVQSFDAQRLVDLGRIHGRQESVEAVRQARKAGFKRINLDLMFGLPGHRPSQVSADLATALALEPEHISYYQLTLEPNTLFYHQPPVLPDAEQVWRAQEQGHIVLAAQGYERYEISAHARPGQACRHNLNYWCFGDYLGIGPGAHGKLSLNSGSVRRSCRLRQPEAYLAAVGTRGFLSEERLLNDSDLCFEFMLNAMRLVQGVSPDLFNQRTGMGISSLEPALDKAVGLGLLEWDDDCIRPTRKGLLFLDDLLQLFLDEPSRGGKRAVSS